MSVAVLAPESPASPPASRASARAFVEPFVSPWFDGLLIGGGLSLLVGLGLAAAGVRETEPSIAGTLAVLMLFSNSAHFAASTVRLYTKPGAFRDLPFLTMGFPLVAIAVLLVFAWWAKEIGRHLFALYATWSPYHYAAQAYGLAVMYTYRAGEKPGEREKRLLRWTCLLPFFWAFVNGANSGVGWFLSPDFFAENPAAAELRRGVGRALAAVTFVAPVALLFALRRRGVRLPGIALLLVATNGVWWIVFPYAEAFLWATVFHGIQYLAVTAIFHVKDRIAEGEAGRGAAMRLAESVARSAGATLPPWAWHAASFYAMCLLLGSFLFYLFPHSLAWFGLGWFESSALAIAVVNLHHFIVDGYIWKLRKDPNMKIVLKEGRIGN